MQIEETNWLENLSETRQDIMEDAMLLEALSVYMDHSGPYMHRERTEYFPGLFRRLCHYMTQHALELHRLEQSVRPQ